MADQLTRGEFKAHLELRMNRLLLEVEGLIEEHIRYGFDTLQKDYLWKARWALRHGLDWFDWERKRARRSLDGGS